MEAVIRCNGKHGLEYAVNYQQAEYYWEENAVLARLKKMLLNNDAPGKDLLRTSDSLDSLREWYRIYGVAYLKKFDK